MSSTKKPTNEAYGELERAFDVFNAALFDNKLPKCLLTLQREKNSCGYFSANRFANLDGTKVHEIAMNPSYFAIVPIVEVMQTLVHEMTHLWQKHCGTPARGRYHNAEWANKMESIGLMPSSTGHPGGARTGDQMADYALQEGRFMQACNELLSKDFQLSWYDRYPPEMTRKLAQQACVMHQNLTVLGQVSSVPVLPEEDRFALNTTFAPAGLTSTEKKATRTKYRCNCDNAVWGKPELYIICGDCNNVYKPIE
jgi:predicted SprT family Zn-dependent metalloprotease